MNPTLLLLLVLFGAALQTARAGWSANPDGSTIGYFAEEKKGHATLEQALADLAKLGRIEALHAVFVYPLIHQDDFQKELFAVLKREAPRELEQALHSAGNMHNPRMQSLAQPFAKAILQTPTVTKIDAALAPYQLRVAKADFEKLEIRKDASGPRFYCALSLTVSKAAALPKP